jgi:hypothetical protein
MLVMRRPVLTEVMDGSISKELMVFTDERDSSIGKTW